jgi:hypothetical protein
MFISQAVIAVIFRLFNFGLVIILATYAFKKYVLPNVFVVMAQKESEQEFLSSQQILLERKQVELDQLTKQEALLCDNFKIKIDQWKRVVEEESFLQKQEQAARLIFLEKKDAEKAVWQKKLLIQRIVSQKVSSDLESSLSDYFKNEDAGADYLEKIVYFMNERLL